MKVYVLEIGTYNQRGLVAQPVFASLVSAMRAGGGVGPHWREHTNPRGYGTTWHTDIGDGAVITECEVQP